MESKLIINERLHLLLSEKGVHFVVPKKTGEIDEILLAYNSWAILNNHLATVKDYISSGLAKICERKLSKKAAETMQPVLCETNKIDASTALFLSMYQAPGGPREGEWTVFASLRRYHVKEEQMIPHKSPAIYLSIKDIDTLLGLNGKIHLLLKQEKKKHKHSPTDICEICSFIKNEVIIFHEIDCNKDKKDIIKDVETCLEDFNCLNHPGSCVIMMKRKRVKPDDEKENKATSPKKRKLGEKKKNPITKARKEELP